MSSMTVVNRSHKIALSQTQRSCMQDVRAILLILKKFEISD